MRHRPRLLSEALGPLRVELAPATLLAEVQRVWADAAGMEVARHGDPVSERAGTIVVRCDSGVWAAELSMMSVPLVERLNQHLAGGRRVEALRFTVAGTMP